MIVNCRIVPRHDAATDQLKALGMALENWFDRFLAGLAGQDFEGWIDRDGLKDLIAGELPQPFLLRILPGQPSMKPKEIGDALEDARSAYPLLHRALPPLMSRSVSFTITVAGITLTCDDVLASLEENVPMELVSELVLT